MENISNISNGELGLSVRNKLNQVIEKVNTLPEIENNVNEQTEILSQISQEITSINENIEELSTNTASSITSINENIEELSTNTASSITSINENVEQLTDKINSSEFGFIKLTNNPIIYNPFIGNEISFTKQDFGDEVDIIDEENNIAITRGTQRGIYNPITETEWDSDLSPQGTLWNRDGYSDFKDLPLRIYSTFFETLDGSIGENVLNSDLVMFVPSTNKYYKVKFTSWTSSGDGGGFSYTRQELNTSYYFKRPDNENIIDIIDNNIQIARGSNGGWLYNPLFEENHNENSPQGTLWNNDGWNDLSDIENREYGSLSSIFQYNFRNIVGNELIMKDTINNKFYLIKFTEWSRLNQNGGGFAYLRFLLDLNKLNEGIKFPDGTVQKTATTSLKSKAFGTWKIIEKTGSSNLLLSKFLTDEQFNGVTVSNPLVNERLWDIFIDANSYPEIVQSINEGNTNWKLLLNNELYDVLAYTQTISDIQYIVLYNKNVEPVDYKEGDSFIIRRGTGGEPVRWFTDNDQDFRGAIIKYHAFIDNTDFTGGGTFIGEIIISRDSGDYTISNKESFSGNDELKENAVLWYRDRNNGNEREVYFIMKNGDQARLRIHYTYTGFYGKDLWD